MPLRCLVPLVLCAPALFAQQAALNQATAGLEGPAEARAIIDRVLSENTELKTVLSSLQLQEWQQKGAASAYVIQWQSAQQQANNIEVSGKQFETKLDSLSAALDFYFRLEALETTARALNEGAERYGDPANAGKLSRLVAQSFDDRQRLRDYLQDLAQNLEANFKVADDEAQRCRAQLNAQPKRGRKS